MNAMDRGVASPREVVDAGLCIGCGVCALAFSDVVSMVEQEGYNVATQSAVLSKRDAVRFRNMCPGLGYKVPSAGRPDSPWGPIRDAHLAWAAEPMVRHFGSSGGVLTAILSGLLESGEVGAVVGISASEEDPLRNESVVVRRGENALKLAGSRYAPATPFMALSTLSPDEVVAVVGKPCDVAGLRALIDSDPERFPVVKAYLSFFCGGTPSRTATEALVKNLGIDVDKVDRLTYRGDGWPGYFTVTSDEGEQRRTSYAKSWGEVLNKSLHDRCKVCQDSTGFTADIVAADYWEVDDRGYPMFDDREGQSLLIARTQAGVTTMDACADSVVVRDVDLTDLATVQPSQAKRFRAAFPRSIGRRMAGRPSPTFEGVARWRWFVLHPLTSLREARGSFRRARSTSENK